MFCCNFKTTKNKRQFSMVLNVLSLIEALLCTGSCHGYTVILLFRLGKHPPTHQHVKSELAVSCNFFPKG